MNMLLILASLLALSTLSPAAEVVIKENPLPDAKSTGSLTKSDDIEISLGPWLYIKNHTQKTAGWISKSEFEKAFNTQINYSRRFSQKIGKDHLKAMQNQHQKMLDFWKQQEAMFRKTEEMLAQFSLEDEADTSKVSDK